MRNVWSLSFGQSVEVERFLIDLNGVYREAARRL